MHFLNKSINELDHYKTFGQIQKLKRFDNKVAKIFIQDRESVKKIFRDSKK